MTYSLRTSTPGRLRHWITALLLPFLLHMATPAEAADPTDAGRINFFMVCQPSFDVYLNHPSPSLEDWLRDHFWGMQVFSPYFDSRLAWFPRAWFYKDLYGIPKTSPLVTLHLEWILKDKYGNRLYIPFGCANGTCPQYAADISNDLYREWWIEQARATLNQGYQGIFIDDVNTEFKVSDGDWHPTAPFDPSTGVSMTYTDWKRYIAEFTELIRARFPNTTIAHNLLWFGGGPQRDADPFVHRQLMAADYIFLERGVSDGGLTGDGGIWSLQAFLSYIDRLHAFGKAVILGEYWYVGEYPLAGYYLVSNGQDALGNQGVTPENWWGAYDSDLGYPRGPRYEWKGLLRRDFDGGFVVLNPPDTPRKSAELPHSFSTTWGAKVDKVTLDGHQGDVFLGDMGMAFRVNAAGEKVGPFAADDGVSGGHSDSILGPVDTTGLLNAAPQQVYLSKRTTFGSGTMTYDFDQLRAGETYTVRLHFADDISTNAGARLFNVSINGAEVLQEFDIFAIAGKQKRAVVRDFKVAADYRGVLTIRFTPILANALINGIEVIPD